MNAHRANTPFLSAGFLPDGLLLRLGR